MSSTLIIFSHSLSSFWALLFPTSIVQFGTDCLYTQLFHVALHESVCNSASPKSTNRQCIYCQAATSYLLIIFHSNSFGSMNAWFFTSTRSSQPSIYLIVIALSCTLVLYNFIDSSWWWRSWTEAHFSTEGQRNILHFRYNVVYRLIYSLAYNRFN